MEKFSLLISVRQNFSDTEKVTGVRHLLFKSWASSTAGIRCFAVNAHTPSSRYSDKVLLIISPSQWGRLRLSKQQPELVLNISVIKLYLLQQVRRGCARMTQFASFTAIDQMSLDKCSVAFSKVPFSSCCLLLFCIKRDCVQLTRLWQWYSSRYEWKMVIIATASQHCPSCPFLVTLYSPFPICCIYRQHLRSIW